MKKLLFILVIAVPLLAQDSTRNIVPRTAHYGKLGTEIKPWLAAHVDSVLVLYLKVKGVSIGTEAFGDSLYRLSQINAKFSTPVKSRGTSADSLGLKSDFARISVAISMDSAWINTTDTLVFPLPDYTIVLDSIGIYQFSGTAPSVVYKFLYSTNTMGTWTAVITSPATITTNTTKVWQSTLNNATLPANGTLAILCSTVTTKPKLAILHFLGKRQANAVNY